MTDRIHSPKYLGAALFAAAAFLTGTARVSAQANAGNTPPTKFDRFISHFDLGVSATGEFFTSPSGTVQTSISPLANSQLMLTTTKKIGVLATIRAQKSPWVGGEFNFRLVHNSQDFNSPSQQPPIFPVSNTINEFTAGYLARPEHPIVGFQPFLGAGAGTTEFKPSRGSGTGLPVQARATYYYTVGGDHPLVGEILGVRVGFRESFYLAPDFGANYLRIKKFQSSLEPTIGFYVHF